MDAALEFGSTAFWVALIQIIWINILLSGDNSIVIALACRNLPETQKKKGIFWGVGAAIGLRIIFTVFAVKLLQIPLLKLIGGLLLLWIGVQLVGPQEEDSHDIQAKDRLFDAIRTIVIADLAMSIDNVLGVAAAAHGDVLLIVIGLCTSVPLVVWGSTVVLRLIERFPWVVLLGGGLLGYLAGEMVYSDQYLESFWNVLGLGHYLFSGLGVVLVIGIGKFLTWRMASKPGAA